MIRKLGRQWTWDLNPGIPISEAGIPSSSHVPAHSLNRLGLLCSRAPARDALPTHQVFPHHGGQRPEKPQGT